MRMEASRGKKHVLIPFDRADSAGNFSLNSLTEGRYDVIARAITSAFFYSCGVRCDVRMSLALGPSSIDGQNRAVRIDGSEVRHLRPDERTLCSMLQRILGGTAPEKRGANEKQGHRRVPNMTKNKDSADRCVAGWSALPHCFEKELAAVVQDLRLLYQATAQTGPTATASESQSELPVCVLYLMEDGQSLSELLKRLQTPAEPESSPVVGDAMQLISERTNFLIVLGDDRGLSEDQELQLYRVLFGGDHCLDREQVCSRDGPTCFPGVSFYRCCIGSRPLLASQCTLLTLHTIESAWP
jgi:tRNA pseudouridine-54 N-methylase